MNITLQQLSTLEAVIKQGSFHAAADSLHKTHPSIITALRKLENELGFKVFDRSGYRTVLTEQGKLFYERSKRLLGELQALEEYTSSIRNGAAIELNVVIGDVTPIDTTLKILRQFGEQYPDIRLNLFFENLSGPNERLLSGDVDFIIHHIDKSDPRYEYRDFCQVPIVPVVAQGFLPFPVTDELSYKDLRDCTQCIIRDTANSHDEGSSYFIQLDSPSITVGDQRTKKEVILQGMGWGHMPLFLVEDEIKSGQLSLISSQFIQGITIDIVIARQANKEYQGPMESFWKMF